MIGRWMKLCGTLRPWVVAVALAGGSLVACSKGGPAAGGDAAGSPGGRGNEPCEPTAVYGPPPCTKDDDCRGPGREDWLCNPEPTKFDDGCGREVEWGRTCMPGPSAGAAGAGGAAAPAPSAPQPWPAGRTDLPPPLPSRDVGPSEE
jgi:hypothetical protein